MEWKTLGLGVVLGFVLLPILAVIALKLLLWYVKRRLTKFAESIQSTLVPSEITLKPLQSVTWDSPQVGQGGQEFQAQGFRGVGEFGIPEMPGVMLSAWVHEAQNAYGVIYQHPKAGVWADVVSKYPDGTSFTHSSAKETGLDQDPRNRNQKLPGESPVRLIEAHFQERPAGPRPVSAAQFAEDFIRSYRETMEWRLTRGTRPEEVAQIAALSDKNYSPEVIEQAVTTQRLKEKAQLNELLHKRFMEQTRLTGTEWAEIEDRIAIVHDKLEDEELEELGLGPLPEEGTPRERARESGARFLGTVQEPLEADVYVLPEDVEEEE